MMDTNDGLQLDGNGLDISAVLASEFFERALVHAANLASLTTAPGEFDWNDEDPTVFIYLGGR